MPKPEQPASWRPFIKPPAQAKEKEETPLNLEARAQAFLKRIAPLSADLAAHGRTRALALEPEETRVLKAYHQRIHRDQSNRPASRNQRIGESQLKYNITVDQRFGSRRCIFVARPCLQRDCSERQSILLG